MQLPQLAAGHDSELFSQEGGRVAVHLQSVSLPTGSGKSGHQNTTGLLQ
jgi:hypothetical protein